MPLSDAAHFLGQDLQVGPSGDIAMVSGADLTPQRLLRRFLTNAGDYIWQLGYGAGLPQLIGQPAAPLRIRALIQAHAMQESAVARDPPPTVTVAANTTGVVAASVIYGDRQSDAQQALTVPLA